MPFQNTKTITTDKEQKVCHCTLFLILRVHNQEEMSFQNNVKHDLKQLFYRLHEKKKKTPSQYQLLVLMQQDYQMYIYKQLFTMFYCSTSEHGTVKLQLYKYTPSTSSGCNIASTVKRKLYSHL